MVNSVFSIITCTYNSGEYLQKCIDSVRKQDFQDYEHIIVDAYSKDNTIAIVKDYMASDTRVRLIQSEPKGIGNAMNVGIDNSRGSIIQHLHSDDYLYNSNILSYVKELFSKKNNVSVVVGRSARLTDGKLTSSLLSRSSLIRRRLLLRYLIYVRCYIAHPSTFIKKEVFTRNGNFDESFKIAMDYEFWLRIIRKEKFFLVNKELTVFNHRPDAASSDPERNMQEEEVARKKHSKNLHAFIGVHLISKIVRKKEMLNSLIKNNG